MTTPEGAPQGKAGGKPSVTAVIKFLKSAGFQHARYTESHSQPKPSGFSVRQHSGGEVSVHWQEGDDDFFKRMGTLGLTDVAQVPEHPNAERFATEYADALTPRYTVRAMGDTLYLTARETLPARPKGVPTAPTVRRALQAAEVTPYATSWHVTVVDQPDHTRVAVKDSETLKAVRDALTAEGWLFEEFETLQHWALKITGSMPDRRQRVAKLRQRREARAIELAGRAAVAKVEEGIRQAKAAQEAEERPPTGQRLEFVHLPAKAAAEIAAAEEAEPTPHAYDSKGRRWQQDQRAEFKTVDGFLYAGVIVGFGEEGGEKTATVLVDTRRIAPASRAMYKGDPRRPGKPRPVDPPEVRTFPLDKLNKPL